jgi:hypothetical protein
MRYTHMHENLDATLSNKVIQVAVEKSKKLNILSLIMKKLCLVKVNMYALYMHVISLHSPAAVSLASLMHSWHVTA